MTAAQNGLPELMIAAAAEAWRNDGEVMGTGFGPIPRLGVNLCKLMFNRALAITDGECWYAAEPKPLDSPLADGEMEGWSPFDRVFSGLWSGKRHAMVTPIQLDRFGQCNLSVIGDHARPKVAMLGVRGLPGNTMHHANSFFFPAHNRRTLVAGEVDYVCSAGYNPDRYPGGKVSAGVDLRLIVTNLAVLDFGGPAKAIRLVSLHPGVSFEQVQDNTGFDLVREERIPTTPSPSPRTLAMIAALDPNGLRHAAVR